MLTRKQQELLLFLDERISQSGVTPSFKEMKVKVGLKSKSGIHRLISALEDRGFIKKLPFKARAIEILKLPSIKQKPLDEKIEIRGFGTFSKKFIRPRKFVNPKTKKVSYIGETATMHFKPSKALIEK